MSVLLPPQPEEAATRPALVPGEETKSGRMHRLQRPTVQTGGTPAVPPVAARISLCTRNEKARLSGLFSQEFQLPRKGQA